MLRDATNVDRDADVGATFVSHCDSIEVLDETSCVERIRLDDVDPAPYAIREFRRDENLQYIANVRQNGWAGSFPVVRETEDGYQIVEGHKRLWVAEQAGLDSHPVEVVDVDDWELAFRFVVDHLPDAGQVHDGGTADGCYADEQIEAAIDALVEQWDERALEFERVAFNADRLGLDVVDEDDDQADDTGDAPDEQTTDDESTDEFSCDVDGCAFTSKSERGLAIHQGRTHSDDEQTGSDASAEDGEEEVAFWCGYCADGFPTEQGAKTHCTTVHEDKDTYILDVEPDLECDECGMQFARHTDLSNHLTGRCGATLPDRLSVEEFEEIVADAETLLEVNQEIRELSREQVKALIEEHGLRDEVPTLDAGSPQALVESLNLDEDDGDHPEGDDTWKEYSMAGREQA
nr:ParB/RepB/Spo0J family partition protein [Halomicroarcula pellucida]